MGRWFGDFLALLAPHGCAACDEAVTGSDVFCSVHAPLVERRDPEQTTPVRAACGYGGPVAEAIQRLKYGGRTDLAPRLAALFHPLLGHLSGCEQVVPVPLHPRRLRARGFNQAALLGAGVAECLGLPLAPGILHRVIDTPSQTALALEARAENVRQAFRGSAAARDRHVLLVDDVCTTGNTLLAAAQALREQGCVSVTALVLAQTDRGG